MSSHTPRPWVVRYVNGRPSQIMAPNGAHPTPKREGTPITRNESIGLPSTEEGKANAILMAAAPELLEALKRAVQHVPENAVCMEAAIKSTGYKTYTRDFCWDAIAKAEGAK